MNSLWIQKKVDWDNFFEITCPYCKNGGCVGSDVLSKLKYCPYCGARMDLTDASDAELVDMLQDVIKVRDEMIDCLRKELDTKDEELLTKHNEYAQLRHEYELFNAVFEDIKKVLITIRPHEWAKIAKKYNKED